MNLAQNVKQGKDGQGGGRWARGLEESRPALGGEHPLTPCKLRGWEKLLKNSHTPQTEANLPIRKSSPFYH